jgi:hypothetical protein
MFSKFRKIKSVFKGFKFLFKTSSLMIKTMYRLTKLQRFGTIYLSGVFALSILLNCPRAYKQHKMFKKINSDNNYGFYERYKELKTVK